MAAAHEALTDAAWFPQEEEEKNLTVMVSLGKRMKILYRESPLEF